MTRKERREYMRKWRAQHREEYNARRRKWSAEHRDELNARFRKWSAEHIEERRRYKAEDLNSNGVTKSHIRRSSRYILERCHSKLKGYEIHHCFGYDVPEKFIYIPKSLHIQIHQFLRDNNISADEDHWMAIRKLVNDSDEYTYIRT